MGLEVNVRSVTKAEWWDTMSHHSLDQEATGLKNWPGPMTLQSTSQNQHQ
jgi:hypothetical protein